MSSSLDSWIANPRSIRARLSGLRSWCTHGLLLLAGTVVAFGACARVGATQDLCDLRELDPSLRSLGKMERAPDGELRFVKVPDSPSLVACECEIDPWLQSIESQDPIEEAYAAAGDGLSFLLARPLLGSLIPVGVDMRVEDVRQQLELRAIPGVDEHASCFEREKLTLAALEYAKQYNETVLRLVDENVGS